MTMFFIINYLLKLKNFESKENLLIFFNFLHSNYFSSYGYSKRNMKMPFFPGGLFILLSSSLGALHSSTAVIGTAVFWTGVSVVVVSELLWGSQCSQDHGGHSAHPVQLLLVLVQLLLFLMLRSFGAATSAAASPLVPTQPTSTRHDTVWRVGSVGTCSLPGSGF